MEMTRFLLFLVLFLLGFINLYYYLPSKKFYAWLQSLFFKNQPKKISSKEIAMPTNSATQQVLKKDEKISLKNSDMKDELKSVFATFDKNGDGYITKKELKDSLKNIRVFVSEQEVEETVKKVDSNGDGLIDFEEFCYLCESLAVTSIQEEENSDLGGQESQGNGQEVDLREAFDVFDKDKDGSISVEELGMVLSSLGLGKKAEDCKEMIKKVDMDGDGMVNFEEFKKMMRRGSSKFLLVS